jgi:hypothetical protein
MDAEEAIDQGRYATSKTGKRFKLNMHYWRGIVMNTKLLQLRNPGLALLVLLSACSGGGIDISVDGPVIPPLPTAQTNEAITAHGVITGLGGVTINDVRYTTNAHYLSLDTARSLRFAEESTLTASREPLTAFFMTRT